MLPSAPRRRALAALIAAATLAAPACANTFHPAAATVGGVRITDGELRTTIPALKFLATVQQISCGQAGSGESAESACARFALSELIQGRAARTYAAQNHIELPDGQLANAMTSVEQRFGGHAQLQRELARVHATYPELRDLVSTILLVDRVANAVTEDVIPRTQLEKRYLDERLQFTLLHAEHILVQSKALADRIAREATPDTFEELAQKYSTDTGSGPHGGDLGVTRASELDPTFVRAALALRPGEISGPVRTQFGWHIIRLLSVKLLPFQEARPQLVQELSAQGFTKWMAQQAGDIHVNPRYGTFDPSSGRVALVCTTSAVTPCPEPAASATPAP